MTNSSGDKPAASSVRPMITYWDYLKLEQLLSLQTGLEDHEQELLQDESFFIIVHQVFELWFKLILQELRQARDRLDGQPTNDDVFHVEHHIRRAAATFAIAADHWKLMESLTSQQFLDFRDKLFPASGFQSTQLPQIEILCGLEDTRRAETGQERPLDHIRSYADNTVAGKWAWQQIEKTRTEKSFCRCLYEYLSTMPVRSSLPGDQGDCEVIDKFLGDYYSEIVKYCECQIGQLEKSPTLRRDGLEQRFRKRLELTRAYIFAEDVVSSEQSKLRRLRACLLYVESYRSIEAFAPARHLIEAVVELEHQLLRWRFQHARAAERIIGRRIGTGGSEGVDYLDETTNQRVFMELWTVRTEMLPRDFLPNTES